MKIRIFTIIFLIFSGLILTNNEKYNQIKALFDACDQPDVPGGFAVAVVKNGKVVFKKGYGYANYEHKIPFTTSTVSNYASVAKQFTGLAVALLVKKRELHLDSDIRSYIPEVPNFGEKITIQHLLYHTSGIRDWEGLVKISGRYMEDVITDEFIMKLMKNQTDLNFKPGEKFQYSNTGYFLLAKIVSKVAGQSFRDWTYENIFKPLQMNDTHFSNDHKEIIINRASAYKRKEKGDYVNCADHLESYGSSSLFSTIDDMIKWVKNFEKKKIGGQAVWDMMLKKGVLNNKKEVNYGFGISYSKNLGLVNYGHGGFWNGYLSQVSYYPGQNLAYILISNRDPSGVYVDNDIPKMFLDKKSNQVGSKERKIKQRAQVKIDPELLQDYIGFYKLKNFIIIADRVDKNLYISLPWGESVRVYPESDNKFFKNEEVQFSFLRDENGHVNRLIYHFEGTDNPPFAKLEDDASKYSGISELCGNYYCPELQTTYKIVVRVNRLMVEHLQNESISLINIDKDYYMGDKWWFKELRFIRDNKNNITGFKLNADDNDIQNLMFIKK